MKVIALIGLDPPKIQEKDASLGYSGPLLQCPCSAMIKTVISLVT